MGKLHGLLSLLPFRPKFKPIYGLHMAIFHFSKIIKMMAVRRPEFLNTKFQQFCLI